MGNKYQLEFMKELVEEFELDPDIFKCYTLESDPSVRIFFLGKGDWASGHIGILINENFHVLGLGEFSFINEDKKALSVRLKGSLPKNKEILIVQETAPFNDKEQQSIKNKLKEIYNKQ